MLGKFRKGYNARSPTSLGCKRSRGYLLMRKLGYLWVRTFLDNRLLSQRKAIK